MRTRSEVSEKNEYHISKARQYELIWFCRQYPEWQREYNRLSLRQNCGIALSVSNDGVEWADPTAELAIRKNYYYTKMQLVEESANALGAIGKFIFMNVVDGLGYEELLARYPDELLWSKQEFYKEYHHFFYILSHFKQGV